MRLFGTLILQVSIPAKKKPHTSIPAQGPVWRTSKVTEASKVPELALQLEKLRWSLHDSKGWVGQAWNAASVFYQDSLSLSWFKGVHILTFFWSVCE